MNFKEIKKNLRKQIEYDQKRPKKTRKYTIHRYYDATNLKHFLETHKHSFENVAQAFNYILKGLEKGEF